MFYLPSRTSIVLLLSINVAALTYPNRSCIICYLNVVGFPLCLLVRLLREAGVAVRPRPEWALHPKVPRLCRARHVAERRKDAVVVWGDGRVA